MTLNSKPAARILLVSGIVAAALMVAGDFADPATTHTLDERRAWAHFLWDLGGILSGLVALSAAIVVFRAETRSKPHPVLLAAWAVGCVSFIFWAMVVLL